jgi:hypothetical protein
MAYRKSLRALDLTDKYAAVVLCLNCLHLRRRVGFSVFGLLGQRSKRA